MLKAAAVCLLVASATAAPAKGTKILKMKKNMRSIKSDHARVIKHLNTLLVRAVSIFLERERALPRPQKHTPCWGKRASRERATRRVLI
jgi:hypothetical protein